MMTRKHINKIAEILKKHRKTGCLECDDLNIDFAVWLKTENQFFDVARFYEACDEKVTK